MSYAMNLPMSWEAFKSMPLDLQQTYIDGLASRFGVGAATISREMFQMSDTNLSGYMKRYGLKPIGTRSSQLNKETRAVWENWLNPPVEPVKEEPIEETPVVEEEPKPTVTLDPLEEPTPLELPVLRVTEPVSNVIHPEPFSLNQIINDPNATGGTYEQVPFPAPSRGFQLLPKEEKQTLEVSDLSATFKGKFEAEKFLKWVSMLPMPDGQVKIRVEVIAQ